MDFRTLQYMVELAEGKSTAQVAKACYVSRQAISQAIHKLERELGTELFVHSREGLSLTVPGRHVYSRAKVILREQSGILSDLAALSGARTALVRVGFGQSIYMSCPTSFLDRFRQENLNIELTVRHGHVNRMFEELDHSVIDLLITASPFSPERYESILLRRQPLCCVVRRDDFPILPQSLSFEKLENATLLFAREHYRFSDGIVQYLNQRGIPFRAEYSPDSELFVNLRIVRDRPGTIYPTNGNWRQIICLPDDLAVLPMRGSEDPSAPSCDIRALRLRDRPLTGEMSRLVFALKAALNAQKENAAEI